MAAKKKKTTSAKKKTTGNNNHRLTEKDKELFKELLLEKRREIVGNVSEMHEEALRKSRMDAAGDLSSMPIHMADIGTDNYEQEFALGLMDSERKLLREIDFALKRLDQGIYGVCLGTRKTIPKARLNAQPWARYCVEYARLIEEGKATEPDEQE